ncbi:ATPase [candidate division TA06 bacterium]|uniref:ATPase n=1 Tax=candidate division TA06 bacterium TaxID=2250710 RepID=A0A523UTY7_UNCT6|nr:MAG: ATPase [candidate division TA06 bacterium]
MESLQRKLRRIDGRGYKAYKEIRGVYQFQGYTLFVDHVQGDPFAAPSRVRVRVKQQVAKFSPELFKNRSRRIGVEDYLVRAFSNAIDAVARGHRGSGKSGMVSIASCGQEILERSAVVVNGEFVEVRFLVGLPARGRMVLGKQAEEVFFQEIPLIVSRSLLHENTDRDRLSRQVDVCEDADFIRSSLVEKGYVCFIANDSILPRKTGIDDRPMNLSKAVPILSPESLSMTFDRPNSGTITGMAIPEGVTLIVGGGYHGKSTLLRAIERGVYNHILEDGREFAITDVNTVKVRAEDGRRVEKVDISAFLANLPTGIDTRSFSSDDASGSTSQAASIVEGMEVGAKLLLMDEDTCATNFMIRDRRMQELISKDKEPITPFLDRVRELYSQFGVSSILVLGGSGDYFDVADTVISMDTYQPRDVTSEAKEIAARYGTQRAREVGNSFSKITQRAPLRHSFNPRRGKREVKIDTKSMNEISFGTTRIDLLCVEQLVDVGQARAIGDAIHYMSRKYADGSHSMLEIVEMVSRDIEKSGLDVLSPFRDEVYGDYALPRKFEIAAAINRMRTLTVKQLM